MKRVVIIFSVILFITNCKQNPNSNEDKLKTLNELKIQQANINKQINTIEKELGLVKANIKTVKIQQITAGGFSNYVEIQGAVDAEKSSMVSARTMGNVTRVNVKAGDYVSTGQTLAVLDNSMVESGLKELESQLVFAQNIYNKQKNLWEQQIGTEVQYLSAKNNVEALEKKIASVKIQGGMSYVKAPFSGVINEAFAKPGQTLAPGVPAFQLVNMQSLKVKADVAEKFMDNIKQGSSIDIVFPDLDNKSVTAKVSLVSKTINPMNRTVKIEANIPNTNNMLKPNMVAILKIKNYTKTNSISVPINCIINEDDKSYVFVAEESNGKMVSNKREIKTGQTYNSQTEVIQGLQTGDKVITFGFQELLNGDIINIQ